MGIFGNKKPVQDRNAAILSGDTSFSFDDVVGESFYRKALLAIIAGATPEERASGEIFKVAVVAKEPNNPYDSNAIVVRIDEQTVGHIAAETTSTIRDVLSTLYAQGYSDFGFVCDAVIGWNTNRDDAPIGVRLDLVMSGDDDEDDA